MKKTIISTCLSFCLLSALFPSLTSFKSGPKLPGISTLSYFDDLMEYY